jgi:hypothetical protein
MGVTPKRHNQTAHRYLTPSHDNPDDSYAMHNNNNNNNNKDKDNNTATANNK